MADNTVDSLALEISANTGNADKAIDRLASSLAGLAKNLNLVEIAKLSNLSSSFYEIAGAAQDFAKALNSIDFSGLAGSKNSLDNIISENVVRMMEEFGIKGKDSFRQISKEMASLVEVSTRFNTAMQNGANSDVMVKLADEYDNASERINKSIRSMANSSASLKSEVFQPLVNYINQLNRSGNKISVPFSEEFGGDWSRMRSSLGKAFTSQKGGTDFEVFITELNEQLGNVIDTSHGAEAAFQDLYDKLRLGRGIVDEFNTSLSQMSDSGLNKYDVNTVLGDAVENIQRYKNEMATMGESTDISRENSEFGNLKNAVDEVTKSVRSKTSAFQSEGTTVESVVKKEISSLTNMKSMIDRISVAMANMGSGITGGSTTGFDNLNSSVQGIQSLATSLGQLTALQFDSTGIREIANAIGTLGRKSVTQAMTNIPQLISSLRSLTTALQGLTFEGFDITGLSSLTESISRLGGAAAGRAASGNITALATALKQMMTTLSTAPKVSSNLIQMTQALAQFAAAGGRAGTATKSLSASFNLLPTSTNKAKKSFSGLAGAIGRFYATYWLLIRAFSQFKNAIDISSDLTEVQNVVDVTFGNMSQKIEDFSNTSLQMYGMSELTAKNIASRYQAMGVAMGFATGEMSDMSIRLTELVGDMSSFYNVSQDQMATAIQSIFTGETEPLILAA